MKTTLGRRWLSIILTMILCLSLTPAAWAEGEGGGAETTPSVSGGETAKKSIKITTDTPLLTGVGLGAKITVETDPSGERYAFRSTHEDVASVDNYTGDLTAHKPGETEIYAFLQNDTSVESKPLRVEVSGIAVIKEPLTVNENGTADLKEAVKCFGDANEYTLSFSSRDTYIAEVKGSTIYGLQVGEATIEARANGGAHLSTFKVEVTPDSSTEIKAGTLKSDDILSFSSVNFSSQLNNTVRYVTGLLVPTNQGTLYYKYRSEAEPGAGVAQMDSYYRKSIPTGQRALDDITFVPKPGYQGNVIITYTAVTDGGKNYSCKITLTVEGNSSGSSRADGILLTTPYGTPVKLSGAEFDRVCRELHGVGVNTVTLSQPSNRQGALYTDYVSEGNYGSAVSTSRSYTRQELDNIWFVPAAGFSGRVTIPYTARGRGSSGGAYTGSLTVEVGERNDITSGGPAYATANGGLVSFDDWDFENYRRQVLPGWNTLSYVRFDSLPGASQGVLYYDYRSASSTGSRVEGGSYYYYGTRTPRLDRLTFVPAENFVGTVRIPFTGWDRDGRSFSGEVEIAVRGSSGKGDIRYTCVPGRSVSFRNSDFTDLCRELTGRTLNYIVLRDLPDRYSEGSLYHSSSRISSTGTRYYANTSGAYRISRLSFEANSGFVGSADIPFVGYASNGDSFEGVITIDSSGVNDWTIHYRTGSGAAAVFDRDDFDGLSQWSSRENVRSVRFQVPSASQGDLYRNYYSSTSKGTRISSSSTSVSRSSLNQVAFVPVKSYAGTVYIDFTATSDDGSVFNGTVEITVERAAADVTTPTPTTVNFYDVDPGAYYANAVKWAVNNGITSGTSSFTFSPGETCTVAQILTFLYRANGSPRVTGSSPFTDVRTSDYYYEAALWAYQKGLVSGSAFRPYSPCTRGMVVTYLWKLAGQPTPAARPLSYAPYTLSGKQEYGNFTLRFDAAVTAKTKVTLHYDMDYGDHIQRDWESAQTRDVTLIAVRPGSAYTIDGGFYGGFDYSPDAVEWFNGVPASLYFRASDGSFRYTVVGKGHDDSEFALFSNSLSWFRENGRQESETGNNYSADCGALIELDGAYYFVTYADSAIAGGLLSGSAGFSDVAPGAAYEQAVAWATEKKITTGTSGTTFSPDNICTRGQIVTFLYRAMGW